MFDWLFRPSRRSRVPANRRRLEVEVLEDRCVPSISSPIDVSGSGIAKTAPATASSAAGYSVVVWSTQGAGGNLAIFANLYKPDHTPMGATIEVSDNSDDNSEPAVAMSGTSDFVVVWTHSLSTDSEVDFALFHNGQKGNTGNVNDFRVLQEPQVAMDKLGGFAISYTAQIQPNDVNQDLYARRFDSQGSQLGATIAVATSADRTINGKLYIQDEYASHIDIAGNGRISISYVKETRPLEGQPRVAKQIQLRQYSSSGVLTGKYTIAKVTGNSVPNHDVAVDAAGNCVVVYDRGKSSGDENIYMRLLSRKGVLQNVAALVSSSRYESNPCIAMDRSDGRFVIAYHREVNGADQVLVRKFSRNGKELAHYGVGSGTFEGAVSVDGLDRFFVAYWSEAQGILEGRFGNL